MNEQGLRQDYWDLHHLVRKTSRRSKEYPTLVAWLARTRQFMADRGISP